MDELTLLQNRIRVLEEILTRLIKSGRLVLDRDLQLQNGRNIITGTGVGTIIATETSQKLGFYATTPVNQPDTVSDAVENGASYVQNDVNSIGSAVNAIIDRLQEIGLIA